MDSFGNIWKIHWPQKSQCIVTLDYCPIGDLCRCAIDRGHGGATTWRPSPTTQTWWWWLLLLCAIQILLLTYYVSEALCIWVVYPSVHACVCMLGHRYSPTGLPLTLTLMWHIYSSFLLQCQFWESLLSKTSASFRIHIGGSCTSI